MIEKITKTDAEWQKLLTPEQYRVCRAHGTEAPFSGCFVGSHDDGIYCCVCCDQELFASSTKFESGTGWPSYCQPVAPDRLLEKKDVSHGMVRTEVLCRRCEAHLGHVFPDGPPPTGLRYCINSVALNFKKK